MKTARGDASSSARLAGVHSFGRVGKIANGIFRRERAGFVTHNTLHIDGGPCSLTLRSFAAIAIEAY